MIGELTFKIKFLWTNTKVFNIYIDSNKYIIDLSHNKYILFINYKSLIKEKQINFK